MEGGWPWRRTVRGRRPVRYLRRRVVVHPGPPHLAEGLLGPPHRFSPYVVEVDKEDLYGFTLVGKSGVGVSKQPPQAGDMPHILVEVDLTKPLVRLLGAEG